MPQYTGGDLKLPRVGFGMWDEVAQIVKDTDGKAPKPDPARDAAQLAVVKSAMDLGYRHFDSAEMYAAGQSETILGGALQERDRGDFIITTKVNAEHLGYDDLIAACDRSLQRLQTSYIDLYLIHWPNPEIPLAESFRALNQLTESGKIRHVGVSNFSVPLLEQAISLCDTPLATNQVLYNLVNRARETDGTVEFCQQNGIALTAYAPLRFGVTEHPAVVALADRVSATPAQIAINWLTRKPGVITIPHSGNSKRQQENLEAADLLLKDADVEALEDQLNER